MNTLIVIGIPLALQLLVVGTVALRAQLRFRNAIRVIAERGEQ